MAIYLGSLVQLCCGEVGTLQTNTAGMCGECSQWMDHTGFSTAQGGVCFPDLHCLVSRVPCKGTVPSGPCISCTSQVYTAQVLGCSTGAQTQIRCAFCAIPRSNPLCQLSAWRDDCPRWAVHLMHLSCSSCLVSQVCHKGTVPGVLCVFSGELISGCDTPGRCELSKVPGGHG